MPTRRIALCMNLNDFYEHGIARGVVRYARQRGSWQLFGYGWMFQPLRNLRRWRGAGILSRVETRQAARHLAATGLPVVDVAGAILDAGFYQVNNDDYETGRLAARNLLPAGFRSFAYCGVRSVGWSAQRKAGFFDVVGEVCPAPPVFEETLLWWERPEIAGKLRKWLVTLPRPCALFACNDTAGLKITETCRALGLRVPDEVAVIGVDNEDVVCELSAPPLSSIPCDCERIGYEAAATLDRLLDGQSVKSPVLVPPRPPVLRASSDTVATADASVRQALRYIRDSVAQGINVYDVLRHTAASRRSLELRFRRQLGTSVHREIVRTRLEQACRLLLDPSLPVAKIALLSGFSSPQRFYSSFRAALRVPPLVYRKKSLRPEHLIES